MKEAKRKYIRILKIELDDLQNDLEAVMQHCIGRKQRHEISNYVCMENMALVKNDIEVIESVSEILDELDLDAYADLDELTDDVKKRFGEMLEQHGRFEPMFKLLDRKLTKVGRYVRAEPD